MTTINGTSIAASFSGEPALPAGTPTATDVSYFGTVEILGPDAETLMVSVLPEANVKSIPIQTIVAVQIGGASVALWRMCETNFRAVLKVPGTLDAVMGALKTALASSGLKRCKLVDSSAAFVTVSLLGASDPAILSAVWTAKARAAVAELVPGKFTIGRIGDDHGAPLIVSKEGTDSWEVWCAPRDAAKIWGLFEKVDKVGVDAWRKVAGV